mgnify:FL=1|tara:strand:+ start:6205 stop:6690 length:486 start_codon:yes stop_codon:yes gene_type:complete
MANRILIGSRATGGYGAYVSKHGEDVLTTTNGLLFDSRMGSSLVLHSHHQGSMAKGATSTITHNLGYKPLFAIRWTDQGDISSGVATKAWTPSMIQDAYEEYSGENYSEVWAGISITTTNNAIAIKNEHKALGDASGSYTRDIYWACVIFHEADYTDGRGL